VTDSLAASIRTFALEFRQVLPEDVLADVLDWCDHHEWLLALEVLAEKLYEHGLKIDQGQWDRLRQLVEQSGGTLTRFEFIEPPR
jgi:hypothetical protein